MEYTWVMRFGSLKFITLPIALTIMLAACGMPEVERGAQPGATQIQTPTVRWPEPGDLMEGAQTPVQGGVDVMELTQQADEAGAQAEVIRDDCGETRGRIERRSYPGLLSGELIPIRVYLPPCYDPFLHLYPVIILLHGKPQDEGHWQLLGAHEVVNQGIVDGGWPALVLVMPYLPEPLFTETDGGPGSLEQEIMQGLIPYLLDHFAITGEGQRWALAGISRGGVWALELGLRYPEQFENIAALSPALNVNYARPAYDPFQILENIEHAPVKIFLGAGDFDSDAREDAGTGGDS